MFLPGDIYTTSGSLKLYHCWTDKVTKYDSSSFYNWEQDNLPIYDLEERTFYLWEQLGYPTSSIPGVALVVSGDAPDSVIGCNKNIFRTVSAAIEALPQVINFPIIIEVANFGELGTLTLNNYKFGPRGSLEIINRNFSKQEYSLSSSTNTSGLIPQISATYFAGTNPRNYVGSFDLIYGLPPAAEIKETTPMQGFLDSSCLSISAAVFSGTRDARLSGVGGLSPKLNGYVSVYKRQSNCNKSTLIIDSKNNVQPYTSDEYGIAFKPYVFNPESSDDIHVKDASTIDYLNNNSLLYSNNDTAINLFQAFNGLYYGNKLNKVYINNCDGPIFIRNFFLDGKGSTVTTNQYGVEVNNSPNIYLENIVSTRYRKAGFYFNNSTVNLLRSCVANRIYDFDSSNRRITGNFSDRRIGITFNDASSYLESDQAAGLVANNSYVNFSSTRDWEYAKYSENLTTFKATPNAYHVIEFNDNANGVILNNSVMVGGDSRRSSSDDLSQVIDETIFDFNSNVNCGFIANNSKVSLNGLIRLRENLKGLEANSSELEVESLEAIYNQNIGVELNNSIATYNKNLKKYHSTGTLKDHLIQRPGYFLGNGIHLNLNSSKMLPQITSGMELRYCDMRFESPIGSYVSGIITESIRVNNNSELCLISPRIIRDDTHSRSGTSKKGSEINCSNNSKTTIRGTRYFPTRIIGPNTRDNQKNIAAIAANQNSVVDINGPTIVAQFGIDLLADKNSTINVAPPKSDLDGVLDISSINLNDSANHTMVELHSTRACVVVDNQSTLNMKDLGSYRTRWNVTGTFNSFGPDYGGVNDTAFNTTYVSGGSMQFYPNPNAAGTTNAAICVTATVLTSPFVKYPNGYGATYGLNNPVLTFSSVTFGGMCVRALNNSVVNVHNVNFPCGWWNPSAPYYDKSITFDSGGACYRPFIWNIADSSQLKASFLSVSGLFPRLAGYVGPYGYWKGSDNNAYYGAPSSTPDTSAMSILDIFGANPSGTAFTNVTATNYGPFRLYFGVNPFVNSLTELNGSGGVEIIKQIYSQGYQPSASLLCSGSPSSIYNMALIRNSNNVIAPSGFYYGSGVTDMAGHTRVLLDESSSETFANAKHCAAGRSGNSRLVSIYYPYTIARYGDTYSTKGIASVNTFDIERDN